MFRKVYVGFRISVVRVRSRETCESTLKYIIEFAAQRSSASVFSELTDLEVEHGYI